ncbi:hypothetical protein [Arthrobacter sp. CP30]
MNGTEQQPTKDDRRFLREMGMTEVEPGRWVGAPEANSPGARAFLDDIRPEEQEQLALLMCAGRVQNKFALERGDGFAATVHSIAEGTLLHSALSAEDFEHSHVDLAVFIAIEASSAESVDEVGGDTIERVLDEVAASYPLVPRADAIAVALRKLGIKSKAIHIDAHTAGPGEGPDPRDYA